MEHAGTRPRRESKRTRPMGRERVMETLIDATIELIVAKGLHISVREIASRAGVNHGLVHTYFGSRHGLLVAAANEVTQRAGADADEHGFPPPDLASRRSGQLAKAMARIRLDSQGELFAAHPVSSQWKRALLTSRPELPEQEIDTMVATASALGRHIERLVAELGGLPTQAESAG